MERGVLPYRESEIVPRHSGLPAWTEVIGEANARSSTHRDQFRATGSNPRQHQGPTEAERQGRIRT